jgi:hypothetical protein
MLHDAGLVASRDGQVNHLEGSYLPKVGPLP